MKRTLILLFAAVAQAQHPELPTGPNADLGGALLMPPGDEWNRDVSRDEVDPLSDAIIAGIGAEKGLHEDFGLVWKGQPGGIQEGSPMPAGAGPGKLWLGSAHVRAILCYHGAIRV